MGQFKNLARRVEQLADDIDDGTQDAAESGLDSTKQTARMNLEAEDAVWTGHLGSRISVREVDTPRGVSSRTKLDVDAPYAGYVEMGTGIYFGSELTEWTAERGPFGAPEGVPFEKIRYWVYTKPVIPRAPISQQALAWIITRQIANEGTEAHPFLRPAWFVTKEPLVRGVERAVSRAVNSV